jgi:hypothetical protein
MTTQNQQHLATAIRFAMRAQEHTAPGTARHQDLTDCLAALNSMRLAKTEPVEAPIKAFAQTLYDDMDSMTISDGLRLAEMVIAAPMKIDKPIVRRPPAKLNGYPVVGWVDVPDKPGYRPHCVFIADKSGDAFDVEYVVSDHVYGTEGWGQGHYISDHDEAFRFFFDRARTALRISQE